jgi:hypothetical protein
LIEFAEEVEVATQRRLKVLGEEWLAGDEVGSLPYRDFTAVRLDRARGEKDFYNNRLNFWKNKKRFFMEHQESPLLMNR